MRITKHIENLLLKENVVVVPNLGSFVAHNIPARYDKEENIFYPPVRTLGFNTKLNVNDYLLVQSYIDAYNMSLPDAIKEMEKDVTAVKEELTQNGKVSFEGIGTLSYDNGNYNFEPCLSGILTPGIYGLDLIELQSVATLEAIKHSDDKPVNAILKPSFQPSEEKKNSIFAKKDDKPIVITIQRSTLRKCATAAAVAAFALLSVIPIRYAANNMDKMQEAAVVSILGDSKAEQANNATETAVVSKPIVKKPELQPAPMAEKPKYTIVLAAGLTTERAALYTDSLKNEGISATFDESKHHSVVTYGTYESKSDAKEEIAKHSSHPRFECAWVKKIKK